MVPGCKRFMVWGLELKDASAMDLWFGFRAEGCQRKGFVVWVLEPKDASAKGSWFGFRAEGWIPHSFDARLLAFPWKANCCHLTLSPAASARVLRLNKRTSQLI